MKVVSLSLRGVSLPGGGFLSLKVVYDLRVSASKPPFLRGFKNHKQFKTLLAWPVWLSTEYRFFPRAFLAIHIIFDVCLEGGYLAYCNANLKFKLFFFFLY